MVINGNGNYVYCEGFKMINWQYDGMIKCFVLRYSNFYSHAKAAKFHIKLPFYLHCQVIILKIGLMIQAYEIFHYQIKITINNNNNIDSYFAALQNYDR